MSAAMQPNHAPIPLPRPANQTRPSRQSPPRQSMTRMESLALWHNVTVAMVSGDMPDLSARQLAVVMSVYIETGPQTVRSLAKKLNVTKAVIVRAIDKLEGLSFVQRAPDPRDKRSIVLTRTPNGIRFLSGFAEVIQGELSANPAR